jgi:Flp pilus assembly protein TadD
MATVRDRVENALSDAEDAINAAFAAIRKLEEHDSRAAAVTAINQIRSGDYNDAITTLEREFLPKWSDRAECDAEYRLVMPMRVTVTP